MLEKRVFFAFMPSLLPGDEGVRAWRFFPSPQDQIDRLVSFVTEDLGLRTFGAFYPTDNYGPRMTGLLDQKLTGMGITLHSASYTPGQSSTWSGQAATLINPTTQENITAPIPQTQFEALFLPDSWKNMNLLTTSLMYNGEDRLVLLGTTLWEQGLDYNHGTGHGVGYILSVHEGPQSCRWHSLDGRRYPLEEGMVISNEPGYYKAGKFGIRHENLVLVRTGDKTEFGQFMYLEPLTMAPFDRDAIDVSLLTEGELAQLNDYHRQVYATVSPLLDAEEQAWLAEATAPLTR